MKLPKTEFDEPIRKAEELMAFVGDLPESKNREAMMQAVTALSTHLSELRSKSIFDIGEMEPKKTEDNGTK